MTYIHIVRYSSGTSVKEQIDALLTAGKIDADTRLFFSKNQYITMQDLSELEGYFDFVRDDDFDCDNLVLKPREYILKCAEEKRRY